MSLSHTRFLVLIVAAPTLLVPAIAVGKDIAPLIAALQQDPAHKVRLQAAVLLGRSGANEAIAPLVAALRSDSEALVRVAAATALGQLTPDEAVPPLLEAQVLDATASVRQAAVEALSRYETERLRMQLVFAFDQSPNPAVRRQAVQIVGALRGPEVDAVLVHALGDETVVFEEARAALLRLPAERLMPVLDRACLHELTPIRLGCVRVLASVRSPDAAEMLVRMFERDLENDEVRRETETSLRSLQRFVAVGRIVAGAAADRPRHERARALHLLGVLGGDEARRVLRDALTDPDPLVRGNVVMAIERLGDPALIPDLEQALQDRANAKLSDVIGQVIATLKQRASPPPGTTTP